MLLCEKHCTNSAREHTVQEHLTDFFCLSSVTDGSNEKAGSTCVKEANCLVSERVSVSLSWPPNARWQRYSWTCCCWPAEKGVQAHKKSYTHNILKKKINGLQCKHFHLMLKENNQIKIRIKLCRHYLEKKQSMVFTLKCFLRTCVPKLTSHCQL